MMVLVPQMHNQPPPLFVQDLKGWGKSLLRTCTSQDPSMKKRLGAYLSLLLWNWLTMLAEICLLGLFWCVNSYILVAKIVVALVTRLWPDYGIMVLLVVFWCCLLYFGIMVLLFVFWIVHWYYVIFGTMVDFIIFRTGLFIQISLNW